MKKFVCIFIVFICSSFNLVALAYVSGKVKIDEKLFYCPTEINCPSTDIKSCNVISNAPEKWDSPNLWYRQPQEGGVFKFAGVTSPYQSNSQLIVTCEYPETYNGRVTGAVIKIQSKPMANIESYYEKSPNWIWHPSEKSAACYNVDSTACPLKEKAAVVIHNKDVISDILTSVI